VPAASWLNDVFARWRGMRPRAAAELHLHGVPRGLTFVADATLEQGLLNLFNNAADAGTHVRVTAQGDEAGLTIEVCDDGPGFSPQVLQQAGRAPFPAHERGSGVGLFLAHAAITRLRGDLSLGNDGGGFARVRLPATSAN